MVTTTIDAIDNLRRHCEVPWHPVWSWDVRDNLSKHHHMMPVE